MKTNLRSLGTPVIIGALLHALTIISPGQTLSEPSRKDSVVALVADANGLPQIPREELPFYGTFWVVRNSIPCIIAPLPCPPLNQSHPVYAISSRQFLVDETDAPLVFLGDQKAVLTSADYAAIIGKQVDDLLKHVAFIQHTELEAELRALDGQNPTLSGEGGESAGVSFDASNYGIDDLWIEITGINETALSLVVHGTVLNEVYALQSKTNLEDSGWAFEGEGFLGQETQTLASVLIGDRTNTLFLRALSLSTDTDGSGLPDWWQLYWFGSTGNDPYGDSDQDGWTTIQEFQNGTNPGSFNLPPAPLPMEAFVNVNENTATVRWNRPPGPVQHYVLERSRWDSTINNYVYDQIAAPAAGVESFEDTGFEVSTPFIAAIGNEGPYSSSGSIYRARAVYSGGSSQTAETVLNSGIPPLTISARLVLGAEGRWELICPALPPEVKSLRLEWFTYDYAWDTGFLNSTQHIAASSIVGGRYVFSLAEILDHFFYGHGETTTWGHDLWVRGVDAVGRAGMPVRAGQVYQDNAPYWVDGREHLRQNLNFRLRAATMNEPVEQTDGSYWGPDYLEFGLPSDTGYVESGHMHWSRQWKWFFGDYSFIRRDNLRPFYQNYRFFGRSSEAYFVWWNVPSFQWEPDFQTIPAAAVLGLPEPVWVAQDDLSEIGMQNSAGWLSMDEGVQNVYGLSFDQAMAIQMNDIGGSITNLISPGGGADTTIFGLSRLFNRTPTPVLQHVDYYFAPVRSPGDNLVIGGPTDQDQPYPLPILPGFSGTARTPVLVVGAGQSVLIGGWARKQLANGATNKLAYLGQYFEMTQRQSAQGVWTNQTLDILSPYGDFFAVLPGPVALVTMPDWGETGRGTAVVHVVSINLDRDGDGVIDPNVLGPDQTALHRPFRFWANNDFDRWHDFYEPDWNQVHDQEEDDLKTAGSPGTVGVTPDCDYQWADGAYAIPSKRDLEDYTRLWLPGIKKLYETHTNLSFELSIRNNDTADGPAINLVLAVESDGGTRYLTNTSVANDQISLPSGKCIGRISPHNTIRLNDFFELALYPGTGAEHFIWCGARRGKGELVLQVKDGSNLLAETSAWLDLKDIKEMYERWTVGDNGAKPPTNTAYCAVEDLPMGISKFQYTSPSDTNTPYILHVHGWNMSRYDKDRYAETAFKRLHLQGYQGRFGSFRWPTKKGFTTFDSSEFNAWKSGEGLYRVLTNLNATYPGRVYLTAHSMGNIVAAEALRKAGAGQLVNTYVAMQAAIASHAYDPTTTNRAIVEYDSNTPDRHGAYWTNGAHCYLHGVQGAGRYVNFFNKDDWALSWWEFDQDNKPNSAELYVFLTPERYEYHPIFGSNRVLAFPADTYEVFSFCTEGRCYALGEQVDVNGPFLPDEQIDLAVPPHAFGNLHKGHSGQFRSTNMQRWPFWEQVLISFQLKARQ